MPAPERHTDKVAEVSFDGTSGKHFATYAMAQRKAIDAATASSAGNVSFFIHPLTVDGKVRYLPVFYGAGDLQDLIRMAWAGYHSIS